MDKDKDSNNLIATLELMDWNLKAKEEDVSRYRKMIEILESREDWLGRIVRDALETEGIEE